MPFKGTVMQIEKAFIAYVFQKYPENLVFQLSIILHTWIFFSYKVDYFLTVSVFSVCKQNFTAH